MATEKPDNHFKQFASSLSRTIGKYGKVLPKEVLGRQKIQVEGLIKLEKKFKAALLRHRSGRNVIKDFIYYICDERKNILAARPFFRERQKIFTKYISKAFKKRSHNKLKNYHFNFQFIVFTMNNRKWGEHSELNKIYKQIIKLRTQIVETNMPLAISRARIFWQRTPRSHLSYMDLVQISSEGLLSAVDKFVLPFGKVFRSVICGRISGNLIEGYSEPALHFYPVDKRKLYRAHKLANKYKDASSVNEFNNLAEEVNIGAKKNQMTDSHEIADLMAASSTISMEVFKNQPEDINIKKKSVQFMAPVSTQPDVMVESHNDTRVLQESMQKLSTFETKILRMKGIEIEQQEVYNDSNY